MSEETFVTKCSDCGGKIIFSAGRTLARCSYCGAPLGKYLETAERNARESEKGPVNHSRTTEETGDPVPAGNHALKAGLNLEWERGLIALEDGEYGEAAQIFDKMVKTDLTDARGWLGKLMVEKKVCREEDLAQSGGSLAGNRNYQRAIRFGDDNLRARLAGYVKTARDAEYAAGKYVKFGHYPQTAGGKDSTPIEWMVLARDGQKALLLSRYGLDAQPYNTEYKEVTWETCSLRSWLNGTFLNKAFTAREQGGILTTEVDNSPSQCYCVWGIIRGKNTQDKIYLLSYAEANKYLGVIKSDSKNIKSRISPTAYAKQAGAYTDDGKKTAEGAAAGWWWLRSPGCLPSDAAAVRADGSLHYDGVYYDNVCVRPALWVDLESDIF